MYQELVTLSLAKDPLRFTNNQCIWLLDHVGDPNSKIRDQLVYSLFARGFQTPGFTKHQKKLLADLATQRAQLFDGIDNPQSDKVFTRTFTALLGALFLDTDAREPFLTIKQRNTWLDWAINYLRLEQDWRGFIPEKGWAHAVAHGSDLASAAVAHPKVIPAQIKQALAIIPNILSWQKTPFLDDEKERLATIIQTASRSPQVQLKQITSVLAKTDQQRWADYDQNPSNLSAYYRLSAWKRILTSLYFIAPPLRPEVLPSIERYFRKMGYTE